MKKLVIGLLAVAICVSFCSCGEATVPQASFDDLQSKFNGLENDISVLQSHNAELEETIRLKDAEIDQLSSDLEAAQKEIADQAAKLDDLENGPAALIVAIRNAFENKEWSEVVSLADNLHSRANGSPEDVEAQSLMERANKEIEKEEAAKAAEEAKGYETGITYEQLNRNPDNYKGQKVTIRGRVFQSFVDGANTILMVNVGGNYNNIAYIVIPTSKLESRIIENDWVVIRGIANGLFTYESTGRGTLSVPWVKADMIER